MFFVVEKARLQRLIALARDDRTPAAQSDKGPFLRIEASDGRVEIDGREVGGSLPATVHEPGVLFLRITLFRRMLGTIRGQKMLAIQANREGLMFDNVTMPLEMNDMLLYVNPAAAPKRHPDEEAANAAVPKPPLKEPRLFDDMSNGSS